MSNTFAVHPLELHGDLASVASIAAVETDFLLRGQDTAFAATKRVSEELSQLGKSENPATVVVMNLALSDSPFQKPSLTRVDQVVKEAHEIRERISALVANPHSFGRDHPGELEKLRAFFVALSKRAAAFDLPYDEPEMDDPIRR